MCTFFLTTFLGIAVYDGMGEEDRHSFSQNGSVFSKRLIFTVQFCSMQCAYDKLTAQIVSFK